MASKHPSWVAEAYNIRGIATFCTSSIAVFMIYSILQFGKHTTVYSYTGGWSFQFHRLCIIQSLAFQSFSYVLSVNLQHQSHQFIVTPTVSTFTSFWPQQSHSIYNKIKHHKPNSFSIPQLSNTSCPVLLHHNTLTYTTAYLYNDKWD